MDDFFDIFLNYLETTPDEELFKEWNKYEELDEVGPRIKDFIIEINDFANKDI